MRRRLEIFALVSATLAALSVGSMGVFGASAQPGNEDQVTICHRTDSATNPYSTITVDVSAVDGVAGNQPGADHFGEHTGPLASSEAVAQQLKDDGIEWGDIIPPIPGVHGGLNWPEGQAMLENNCNFVTPPTTTAPPTTAPPTTAPPTTAPPTTAPPTTAAPPPPGPAAAPPPPGPAAAPPPPPGPAAAPAPGPAVRAPSAPAPVAGQPRGITG
jgi:hypothetical protein